MNISRIWGVRGSQCCRFQHITLNNIKCAQFLSLGLKTLLVTKKNLQNTEIIPILTYFLPDFQFPRGGNNQGILKTEPPPKYSTRGSRPSLK